MNLGSLFKPTVPTKPSVVVIGAGFAGLTAAKQLLAKNYDVTVLEADKRIGGRAHTLAFEGDAGVAFETGATWIHGLGKPDKPNPVLKLAMDNNLISEQPNTEIWWESTYLLPGRPEPLTKSEELLVHTTVESYMGTIESLSASSKGSVADHLKPILKQVVEGTNSRDEEELVEAAWQWRDALQAAMSGSPSYDQSAASLALYTEFEKDEAHAALPTGFGGVVEALGRGIDVKLGHKVRRIKWGKRGVDISCSNGQRFNADAAIVTVSLGVLKEYYGEMFEPTLSMSKAGAIQRLQIGVVDKICVDFGPSTSTSQAKTNASSSNKKTEPLISYSLLWTSSQAAKDVPNWARSIYAIRFGGPEFKGDTESSLRRLIIWMTGDEAVAMEARTNEEVLAGLKAVFKAFPGIKMPEGASWDNAKLYRSRWGLDSNYLGSYSYIACGASPGDVELLKKPLEAPDKQGNLRPVVVFAGEACSVQYIGTVHGAIISAEEGVNMLTESLDKMAVNA